MNGLTDQYLHLLPGVQPEPGTAGKTDGCIPVLHGGTGCPEGQTFLSEGKPYGMSSHPQGPPYHAGHGAQRGLGPSTDILENADERHVPYPLPGHAHRQPAGAGPPALHGELSYEQARETFERCYSYSNCLITLYGNMDYRSVLHFLDREHLSRAASKAAASLVSLKNR